MLSDAEVFEIYQYNLRMSCGRSLCIVGGGYERDEDLDAFDHVCWTNDHWQKGEPIDSMFSVTNVMPGDFPQLKLVAYQGHNEYVGEWRKVDAQMHMPYDHIPCAGPHYQGLISECFASFQVQLGCMPFTGMLAVFWNSRLPWRSIKLVGFDFYLKQFGRVPFAAATHETRPQIEWLARLVRSDKRFIIRPELQRVLSTVKFPRRVIKVQERTNGYIWKADEYELID